MRMGKEKVPGRQTIPSLSFSASPTLYSTPVHCSGIKTQEALVSPSSDVQIQRSSLRFLQPFPKTWPCLRVSQHALPGRLVHLHSGESFPESSRLGLGSLSEPRLLSKVLCFLSTLFMAVWLSTLLMAPLRGPVPFIHSPHCCVVIHSLHGCLSLRLGGA